MGNFPKFNFVSNGVLGSSSSKDMQMGADVQNEKTTASLRVGSLGLLHK